MCHNLAPNRPDQPIHPPYFPPGFAIDHNLLGSFLKIKTQSKYDFLSSELTVYIPPTDHLQISLVNLKLKVNVIASNNLKIIPDNNKISILRSSQKNLHFL